MIERRLAKTLRKRACEFPVVTLTGPRQSGKTTLVRACFPDYGYANLEDPETRELAETDYRRFFELHPAPLVIDEIQRVPKLASAIQVAVDERRGGASSGLPPVRRQLFCARCGGACLQQSGRLQALRRHRDRPHGGRINTGARRVAFD